jgi:hypothetical protein
LPSPSPESESPGPPGACRAASLLLRPKKEDEAAAPPRAERAAAEAAEEGGTAAADGGDRREGRRNGEAADGWELADTAAGSAAATKAHAVANMHAVARGRRAVLAEIPASAMVLDRTFSLKWGGEMGRGRCGREPTTTLLLEVPVHYSYIQYTNMYSIRKLLTSMHYYSRVVINFHTVLNAYYIYIYIYIMRTTTYSLESTCSIRTNLVSYNNY